MDEKVIEELSYSLGQRKARARMSGGKKYRREQPRLEQRKV